MEWLFVAYLMIAASGLTLAAVHGVAWVRVRRSAGLATLAAVALAAAGMALCEMRMLGARDVSDYGRWLWWFHLPVAAGIVSVVLFVRLHLRAGRAWLAHTAIALRVAVVIVNFGSVPNVNFGEIHALDLVDMLGAGVAVVHGTPGPWMPLVALSLAAALAFLLDATIEIWRRQTPDRRSGLATTIGLSVFACFGAAFALGPVFGLFSAPMLVSLFFAPALFAMAYDLGVEHMRGVNLAAALQGAQEELRHSEQRLALAAEAAQAGLWEVDVATGQAWSTARALAQFGLAGSGQHRFDAILARIHPGDRERVQAALVHAMDSGEPMSIEYRVLADDGSVRWFVSTGRPTTVGSPPRRVLTGATLDLTERKRAELELLAAKEAAEAANRAKSIFLANMSHELRTPLHAILGYTQIAAESDATPAQRASLEMVEAASRHLLAVVEDVLDLSRVESGRLRLQPEDFSLRALLESVRQLVAGEAARRTLALQVDTGGLPDRLHGDVQRLRQALLNYVGNAMKFTDQGGITMRCELQAEDAEGLLVRFAVTDTGIGITAPNLARLFQPFQQVDDSSTRTRPGTGLGLAITRRLAQAMGGDTGAESQPGVGSTFWFTARLGRAKAPAGETPTAVAPGEDPRAALRQRHAGARVLLAEDNAVSSRLARRMLEGAGLTVDVAHQGSEALELARSTAYDLILMDLSMPVLDGMAATRAIRQLPGCAQVPVIAVTGNAFDTDRQACEAAGMSGFVTKPIDWPRFWPQLLGWLDAARNDAGHGPAGHAGDAPPPPA